MNGPEGSKDPEDCDVLDPATALAELTGWLIDEGDLPASMRRVAELALRIVPGCDMASVTLKDGDRFETAAATDKVALEIDAAQYAVGCGPCLAAARENRVVVAEDDEAARRWPEFARAARKRGVTSFLAAPFVVRGSVIGVLNLFGCGPRAFGALDADLLETYRRQAAVALSNTRAYHAATALASQLEEAMASRALIEQAKGIVMVTADVDAEAAFGLLRNRSQRENRKLRAVAEDVAATRRW